jgi:hypothetical protein
MPGVLLAALGCADHGCPPHLCLPSPVCQVQTDLLRDGYYFVYERSDSASAMPAGPPLMRRAITTPLELRRGDDDWKDFAARVRADGPGQTVYSRVRAPPRKVPDGLGLKLAPNPIVAQSSTPVAAAARESSGPSVAESSGARAICSCVCCNSRSAQIPCRSTRAP